MNPNITIDAIDVHFIRFDHQSIQQPWGKMMPTCRRLQLMHFWLVMMCKLIKIVAEPIMVTWWFQPNFDLFWVKNVLKIMYNDQQTQTHDFHAQLQINLAKIL